ncbi:hypothetical protein BZG36_00174 [Bifiguratus adelaidae]|uniref:Glycosyltransferase family 8 protein n=1 Tax=Bifiguratus adelaidae TaxID=1938954 RepID=A0A261Y8L1_9FUNG|nr:hypothetical protein BZG36_00174 [Bifiguratus adelaidae]
MKDSGQTRAFITVLTTESDAPGVVTLVQALKTCATKYPVVLVVGSHIGKVVKARLADKIEHVVSIPLGMETMATEMGHQMGKSTEQLMGTFGILSLWQMLAYEALVYLSPHMLPLKNVDELFELETVDFAAAPAVGWPDIFDTGIMFLRPSEPTYAALIEHAQVMSSDPTWDGNDGDLLNTYFEDWSSGRREARLGFGYNVTPSEHYTWTPALLNYNTTVSIAHFLPSATPLPWTYLRMSDGAPLPRSSSPHVLDLVQNWWNYWDEAMPGLPPSALGSEWFDKATPFHGSNAGAGPLSEVRKAHNVWDAEQVNIQGRHVEALPHVEVKITHDPDLWKPSLTEEEKMAWESQQEQPATDEPLTTSQHHEESVEAAAEPVLSPPAPIAEEAPPRKSSPEYPMINWNPAHEPPPDRPPPVDSSLPASFDFKNAWDRPFHREETVFIPDLTPTQRQVEYHHQHPEDTDTRQDQQAQEQHLGSEIASHVFPWEHHQPPTRVWLDEEQARPNHPEPQSAPETQHHEPHIDEPQIAQRAPYAPQTSDTQAERVKDDFSFVNAWDEVPSIQRYIIQSRLDPLAPQHSKQPPITTPADVKKRTSRQRDQWDPHASRGSQPPATRAQTSKEGSYFRGSPYSGRSHAPSGVQTPHIFDNDNIPDDRDLLPLPLKSTSRLAIATLPELQLSIPDNRQAKGKEGGKTRGSHARYASISAIFGGRTPYTSAATTPVREYFKELDDEDTEAQSIPGPVTHRQFPEDFADYRIQWPDDLQHEDAPVEEAHAAWDPHRALDALKWSAEQLMQRASSEHDLESQSLETTSSEHDDDSQRAQVQPVQDTSVQTTQGKLPETHIAGTATQTDDGSLTKQEPPVPSLPHTAAPSGFGFKDAPAKWGLNRSDVEVFTPGTVSPSTPTTMHFARHWHDESDSDEEEEVARQRRDDNYRWNKLDYPTAESFQQSRSYSGASTPGSVSHVPNPEQFRLHLEQMSESLLYQRRSDKDQIFSTTLESLRDLNLAGAAMFSQPATEEKSNGHGPDQTPSAPVGAAANPSSWSQLHRVQSDQDVSNFSRTPAFMTPIHGPSKLPGGDIFTQDDELSLPLPQSKGFTFSFSSTWDSMPEIQMHAERMQTRLDALGRYGLNMPLDDGQQRRQTQAQDGSDVASVGQGRQRQSTGNGDVVNDLSDVGTLPESLDDYDALSVGGLQSIDENQDAQEYPLAEGDAEEELTPTAVPNPTVVNGATSQSTDARPKNDLPPQHVLSAPEISGDDDTLDMAFLPETSVSTIPEPVHLGGQEAST